MLVNLRAEEMRAELSQNSEDLPSGKVQSKHRLNRLARLE